MRKVSVDMNYVIWGAGTWGKRIFDCLRVHGYNSIAFIDNDINKQGKSFENLPIISLDEYKKNYNSCIIVIGNHSSQNINDIIKQLHKNQIFIYFNVHECPRDLFYQYEGRIFPFDEALNRFYSIINGKKIGISSFTFFGIMLYDYLIKKSQDVFIINDKKLDMSNSIMNGFNEKYRFVLEDDIKNLDVILQVNTMYGTDKRMLDYNKDKIPFFEFPYLSDYQNPSLSQFNNIYDSNDRCFIVATGPSLKIDDLKMLHKYQEITFSMNRVYKVFSEVPWRPTYYCASDKEMFLLHSNDLINIDLPYKFLSDWYLPFWEKNINKKGLYRYHMLAEYERENEAAFSIDITNGIYGGATVVYVVLQLAIYMGFKEIYIIGADCEYRGDGSENHNHFIQGYNDSKKATKPYKLDLEQIFKNYMNAKCYAEKHGINIYNATRGGKLEIFERVDFDSLF